MSSPFVRKRYIPKIKKHEENLQRQVCTYLRMQYPNVIFRSDFASGLNLTMNQAVINKSLQSSRSFPDLQILWPTEVTFKDGSKKFFSGLFLELKREGTTLYVTRGPREGLLVSNKHIEEQALMLKELRKLGYWASFAVGFDKAKEIIDAYMGHTEPENASMF